MNDTPNSDEQLQWTERLCFSGVAEASKPPKLACVLPGEWRRAAVDERSPREQLLWCPACPPDHPPLCWPLCLRRLWAGASYEAVRIVSVHNARWAWLPVCPVVWTSPCPAAVLLGTLLCARLHVKLHVRGCTIRSCVGRNICAPMSHVDTLRVSHSGFSLMP
jgi:hypothetical protein